MTACAVGRRCYVSGKGVTVFGSRFPQAKVLELASSSVLIFDAGASLHVGSGVLITPSLLLCASHSLASATANLQGQLFFECDSGTSPTYADVASVPCKCLSDKPQLKIGRVVEDGKIDGLDYALCEVTWIDNRVDFARKVSLPMPDYSYGGELLAIGHRVMSNRGDPTQAAAGKLDGGFAHGPHPEPKSTADSAAREYTYTDIHTYYGMSGGGVFNEKGRLVGIVTGYKKVDEVMQYAFLNLGLAAGKMVTHNGVTAPASARLRQWLGGGPPLLPGDPRPAMSAAFNPPF